MRYLIGFFMILIFGPLAAITGFPLFYPFIFIGVFLFASFPSVGQFSDYRIANTSTVLVRKRHYIVFIPFLIISVILTLSKSCLVIPCKEEYFLSTTRIDGNADLQKISRKEYIRLRNEQRKIYSDYVLDPNFMKDAYTPEKIGYKKIKTRLILACVFTGISLSMLVLPQGYLLTLIYCAIFVPMIFLWIPEYKDAKIMHEAYLRSVGEIPVKK